MSRFADLPAQLRKEMRLKGAKPRIGIYISGLAKYFSPHDSFTTDSTTFDGLISGGFSITKSVPRLGGLGTVSSMTFTVLNEELFSNLFASGSYPNPENEEVNVYLYYDDGTSILDAEREEIYRGIIADFPDIDYEGCTFEVKSKDARMGATIGTFVTDSDAADTSKGLPDISKGNIKPVIYGDHRLHIGNTDPTVATISKNNNVVPMIDLGIDSSANRRWLISEHQLENMVTDQSDSDLIWGFDPDVNRLVQLSAFTVVQNNSSGCIISQALGVEFYDYWYATGITNEGNVGNGDWANHTRMYDGVFTTSSDSACELSGDTSYLVLVVPDWDNQNVADAQISRVGIWARTYYTEGGGAPDVDFWIGTELGGDCKANGTSSTLYEVDTTAATAAGITGGIAVKHEIVDDDGQAIDARVFEVYKRITYLPTSQLQLFAGVRGKEYGYWANSRHTDEDFTEAHADDDGQGNLIENAAGVIEDILLDYMDVNAEQTEHLDETDFATHANWDVTGVCDDTGGNAEWTFAAGSLNGTLTQIATDRAVAGTASVEYRFKYTCAVTTAPDGDFALTITSDFAANTIPIPFVAGTHEVVFISNSGAATASFVIQGSETTSTQGQFSIDNISLVISAINHDSMNTASNDLSTSVLSFAILEQTDSDILLDSILKSVKSVLFYNNEDKITMRTHVSTDGFGVSAANTPSAEDIYEFDPHSHFKVVTGENDGLRYNDSDDDTYTVTMTAGEYTGHELAAEIATQMNASSTPTMTCTYSDSTGKFTITDGNDNLQIVNLSIYWTNAASTIGRLIGFNVGADDTGGLTYTSDYAVWQDSFVEHPLADPLTDRKLKLRKSPDPIYTDVTINYYKSYQSGLYQATTNDTDTTYHAESLKGVWSHDYTRDATTAQIMRDFILDRHMKKYYDATVPCIAADLSYIGLERWDFLNVRHPILDGILGTSEETQKWMHLSETLRIGPKSMSIDLEIEEV